MGSRPPRRHRIKLQACRQELWLRGVPLGLGLALRTPLAERVFETGEARGPRARGLPAARRNIAFSGRIPLPRRVAEWSTNSGTPSLDQQGLACAIYALALFGQLGGRERSHTCHPNATFTTRRRSLVNGSTACPRLPSTTTGERRTSMSTARRVHISTMKRPFW